MTVSKEFVFQHLPANTEEMKQLPEAAMSTPFETAALTVLAFCRYPENRESALDMVQFLSGPREVSTAEKQFIRDRFMDKDYVPRSYLKGAVPANDYTPQKPYAITVEDNPYSYDNKGYAKLYLRSGGADSPRAVTLRQGKDGRWYLWEQFILVDIRKPESTNPWK